MGDLSWATLLFPSYYFIYLDLLCGADRAFYVRPLGHRSPPAPHRPSSSVLTPPPCLGPFPSPTPLFMFLLKFPPLGAPYARHDFFFYTTQVCVRSSPCTTETPRGGNPPPSQFRIKYLSLILLREFLFFGINIAARPTACL